MGSCYPSIIFRPLFWYVQPMHGLRPVPRCYQPTIFPHLLNRQKPSYLCQSRPVPIFANLYTSSPCPSSPSSPSTPSSYLHKDHQLPAPPLLPGGPGRDVHPRLVHPITEEHPWRVGPAGVQPKLDLELCREQITARLAEVSRGQPGSEDR